MGCGHTALDLQEIRWIVVQMRKPLLLLAAIGVTLSAMPATAADQPMRASQDRQEAYRGVRQGGILPLNAIRARVRIPGAELIGIDLNGAVYRLRFMKGQDTAIVHVDGRTGQPLRCVASNADLCRQLR